MTTSTTLNGKTFTLYTESELRSASRIVQNIKSKSERETTIQLLLLSAHSLVLASGNGTKFLMVHSMTTGDVAAAIVAWVRDVGGFTIEKGKIKKTADAMTFAEAEAVSWAGYFETAQAATKAKRETAKAEKTEAAEKAEAEKAEAETKRLDSEAVAIAQGIVYRMNAVQLATFASWLDAHKATRLTASEATLELDTLELDTLELDKAA